MSLNTFLSSIGAPAWLTHPLVILAASLALVATGLVLVWRDFARERRHSDPRPVPQPSPSSIDPAARSASSPTPPTADTSPAAPADPVHALATAIAEIRGETAPAASTDIAPRDPTIEAAWCQIQPLIERAVLSAAATIANVRITLSPPGEPGWSLTDRSFGVYRRVTLDGESIGWLRAEILHDGRLRFRLRAHHPAMALLNAEGQCASSAPSLDDIAQHLTSALLAITRYAAWTDTTRVTSASPTASPINRIIAEATAIANGALVEARAAFHPHQGASSTPNVANRRILDVLVEGRQVALMHIDASDGGLDVSVGVPDPRRLDLARRQHLPAERLASYELAEQMASCAWPALASALQPNSAHAISPLDTARH